jgi:hypothetical protein
MMLNLTGISLLFPDLEQVILAEELQSAESLAKISGC